MQRALDEMQRRRQKQLEYNRQHNITPLGISKAVTDIMDGGYAASPRGAGRKRGKVAETKEQYSGLTVEALMKRIRQLEEQMYRHARDLEFEEAAGIRDEIRQIQEIGLGMGKQRTG